MNRQESGRSMVEMLGVLAIIGILSVGGFSTINYAMQSYRTTALFQLVEDSTQGVDDLYSWSRSLPNPSSGQDYADIRDRICENEVFDTECLNETSDDKKYATVQTSFGKFQIIPHNNVKFKMQLTSIPKDVCNRLKDMEWSANIEWDSPSSCAKTNTIQFYGY